MYYVEYDQVGAMLYDEEQWKKHRVSTKKRQAKIDTDKASEALAILTALQYEIIRDFDHIDWKAIGGKIMDLPQKVK